MFFECPVGDFQCGLRAFRKDAIERLQLQTTGMEFSTEMVVKATLFNCESSRFPPHFRPMAAIALRIFEPGGTDGDTFAFFCSTALAGCFFIPAPSRIPVWSLRFGLWLLPGPRTVGGVTFDYHTLLFCAIAILIGFQSINFAVFTKTFAVTERLVPEDPRLTTAFRYVTLETGLTLGILLILAGAGTWIFGLSYWRSHQLRRSRSGQDSSDRNSRIRFAYAGHSRSCFRASSSACLAWAHEESADGVRDHRGWRST